jgi:hypothetical protein
LSKKRNWPAVSPQNIGDIKQSKTHPQSKQLFLFKFSMLKLTIVRIACVLLRNALFGVVAADCCFGTRHFLEAFFALLIHFIAVNRLVRKF